MTFDPRQLETLGQALKNNILYYDQIEGAYGVQGKTLVGNNWLFFLAKNKEGGVGMLKRLLLIVLLVMSLAVTAFAGVNINTADEKELSSLHGIGPAKAAAIIDYRSEHGKFETTDDLEKVKGIGVKTLEKLRDQITVDEE
ncbi:ComEA family DNA-binding protein [Desulfobacterota bacterium M19]